MSVGRVIIYGLFELMVMIMVMVVMSAANKQSKASMQSVAVLAFLARCPRREHTTYIHHTSVDFRYIH